MTLKLNLLCTLGLCALLAACGRTAPLKYWQTDEAPTEKPVVNYVVSQNDAGEMDLANVVLRAENPVKGGIQEREMPFVVTRRSKEKITFELPETPGQIAAITFPASLGKSFEAEVSSRVGSSQTLVFKEMKK